VPQKPHTPEAAATCRRWSTSRDGNTDGDLDGGTEEGDSTLYYCADANFNVTALVDGTSGSETFGQVVERYLYDPYGKATFLKANWSLQEGDEQHPAGTISACANELLFTGHRLDPESGLYITLHRHYHPTLGRWMQRDPLGYVAGMSLYIYAGNRPAVALDPQGELDFQQDIEKPLLGAGHAVARFMRDYSSSLGSMPGGMSTQDIGSHMEGVLNRYETYRSDTFGGGYDPAAAWIRANADKAIETVTDMVPVAGSGVKAWTGTQVNDQQYPALPEKMSDAERASHAGKAAAEAAILVVAAAARTPAGTAADSLRPPAAATSAAPEAPASAPLRTTQWPAAPGSASLLNDTFLSRRWGGESTMYGNPEGGFYTSEPSPTLSRIGAPEGNTGNFLSQELFPWGTPVRAGTACEGFYGPGGAPQFIVPNAASWTKTGLTITLPSGTP
jgi:RHS repeat-associated protein